MRSIRNAPKRAINLSLNSKVLDMARDMGLNISQTVDALLTEEVLRRRSGTTTRVARVCKWSACTSSQYGVCRRSSAIGVG